MNSLKKSQWTTYRRGSVSVCSRVVAPNIGLTYVYGFEWTNFNRLHMRIVNKNLKRAISEMESDPIRFARVTNRRSTRNCRFFAPSKRSVSANCDSQCLRAPSIINTLEICTEQCVLETLSNQHIVCRTVLITFI